MLQSKAGYIDARPLTTRSTKTSCNARPDHTIGSLTRLVAGTQTGLLGSRMNLPYRAVSKHLDGFRFVLAVSGFRLRARLDFSIPSFLSTASEALPPLLDTAPLIRAPRGLQPP